MKIIKDKTKKNEPVVLSIRVPPALFAEIHAVHMKHNVSKQALFVKMAEYCVENKIVLRFP